MLASIGKACMAVLNWELPAKYVIPFIVAALITSAILITL